MKTKKVVINNCKANSGNKILLILSVFLDQRVISMVELRDLMIKYREGSDLIIDVEDADSNLLELILADLKYHNASFSIW